MAAEDSCDMFSPRDVRYFHFLVNHTATKNLAAGESVGKYGVFVPGFRWTARCWPNFVHGGVTMVKLSLFVTLTANHRNAMAPNKVVVTHIELRDRRGMPARTTMLQPELARGDCVGGTSLYATRDAVDTDCVMDDHFIALCTVAILDWPPVETPLTYIGNDILDMQDLTDVSFKVEGEIIRAHRLILAARSPVFKAELFGEMVESRASCITIQDMRARTFNLMLAYIYKNALPIIAAPDDDGASAILELQHLFVAADRYGLDKLRQICEKSLCARITKETVLLILEFAEEHGTTCLMLKSRCLDFLDVAENFKEVGATDEYLCLMATYPSLKLEVQNRFKRARLV
ncbi:hypothetical protein PR202_gb22806 [Eleusine coracana subsp. coracana]|uniref:BTB domain-containing protein n=1 Tax=Eleusine coracana subsp. coracana TaxID=191504 RepID=A0AAV5FHL8_ELECO|nr:hypothetical protein QOZ80_6BG0486160 [Eleusine coracana subsp. coracana]GJN34163.1 hypothetical protein PR202_gb22806 [Eleusine coracana subsp. coracana]